ncbi:MAG TPA: hypothetical protein VN939_14885 [Chthoniobacterales bacterium]|nr:hypothetical protein [Chthoniobacterales bacterium]
MALAGAISGVATGRGGRGISLLVYPGIDGLSGMPTIFEYAGGEYEQPAGVQTFQHLTTETPEGGMVWLRYRVEK